MKKSILFISCDEAKHICDKTQYDEATSWEKFKLNIRLSWCRITRAYSKRNRQLTKAMKQEPIDCLNENELVKLKSDFEKELSKHK